MSAEREFAKALAEALGPLYRVVLITRRGDVEDTFGGGNGLWERRATFAIPGSDLNVALEVDTGTVEAGNRLIRALRLDVVPEGAEEMPPGTFTHVDRALEGLIGMAEEQVGRPISEMSRQDKRQVVRFLDHRGAFALRKAVETVADALGVSRFTVYNYLDASRED
jgi:hypothetical protein